MSEDSANDILLGTFTMPGSVKKIMKNKHETFVITMDKESWVPAYWEPKDSCVIAGFKSVFEVTAVTLSIRKVTLCHLKNKRLDLSKLPPGTYKFVSEPYPFPTGLTGILV